jgi:hypothetical protein
MKGRNKMKWKNLANYCLDYVIDNVGVSDSAVFLVKGGFSKEDLLELGYDNDTIDSAISFVKNWEEQ